MHRDRLWIVALFLAVASIALAAGGSHTLFDNALAPSGVALKNVQPGLDAKSPFINVRAAPYFAVGDGVADDTAAMGRVATYINSLTPSASQYPTVFFPAGTYNYSGGLVFTSPVRLWGPGATLNYTGSSYAVKMGPDGLTVFPASYSHHNHYIVDGLTFTGGASMIHGIYFNSFITQPRVQDCIFTNFGATTSQYAIFFQSQNWDARVTDSKFYANDTNPHNFIRANGIAADGVTSDNGQTLLTVSNTLATNQATASGTVVGIYTNGAFSRIINDKLEGFAPAIWIGSGAGASGNAVKIAHVTLEVVRGAQPCILYGEASGTYVANFTDDLIVEDSYCNVHNTDFATTAHLAGPASATSGIQDTKFNNNLVLNLTAGQPLVVQNNIASQTGNEANGNRQGTAYPDNPPKPFHTSGGSITGWGGTNGELALFWNGADATNQLSVKAGATANSTPLIQLQNFDGSSLGSMEGSGASNRMTIKGPTGTNSAQFYSDGRFGLLKGIDSDSTGYKHIRSVTGCATAASIGATCDTTVTWGTTSADTNYTPICVGFGITSGIPLNGGIVSKLAASAVFRTVAMTAAAAQYTNIYCQFTHD